MSRFGTEELKRQREENEQLERLLKHIVKMFVRGDLVYRRRESCAPLDAVASAKRLRRVRGLVASDAGAKASDSMREPVRSAAVVAAAAEPSAA